MPYVGGLIEVGYDLVGPIRPFLSYHREYVFHERSDHGSMPELWNLRQQLRSVKMGIGIRF